MRMTLILSPTAQAGALSGGAYQYLPTIVRPDSALSAVMMIPLTQCLTGFDLRYADPGCRK
jgi:hypothetical protein